MKRTAKQLICFAFFLFISCELNDNKEIGTIIFDLSGDQPVFLSEIADNVFLVKPETGDSSLLKKIRQIELFENHILIKDTRPELFVFDKEGNFVRTIGKGGQGPGEYSYCLSFALDHINKHILLKTNVGIMRYDLYGNFIKKYDLKHIANLFLYPGSILYP